MTVRHLTLSVLFTLVSFAAMAQESSAPYRQLSPNDKWEIGVHAGLPFIVGDVDPKIPGFGGGLHVRKSLDHIFSVRGGILYAKTKNEESGAESKNSWLSGSVQLVGALNNFRSNRPMRKILLNGFVGIGFNNFSTEYANINQNANAPASGDATTNAHIELGGGIAFRINSRFNLGLEHTVYSVFGKNADRLDSDENLGRQVTTYRDILHYPHLVFAFNIGKNDKNGVAKSEPLYWADPNAAISKAISDLEARPIYNPTDTDGDGIIDDIDDEDNSPAGARVNTKGVTLDSDGDKVPDYKDKEPFSPPGYGVNADGVAQGLPKYTTETDVNRIVDAKIAAIKFPEPKTNDWFFPFVYFGDNRYDVRTSEYEKLYQVATVLKQNPSIKVVVVGHTDERGPEGYNNVLSYNRANAAIDFLTSNYGIARDRVVLNYAGETSALVPGKGSNASNRRVEFRVAKGEAEQGRPEGPNAGKGGKTMNANKSGF
ncbi:MAG TPA: OmpA family protein [Saprospiraceae bacterium]|nr:OmpA family protein [Saprospiraceae bacterium]HNG88880.1 OmpA family protein [Saprospiraceae bacterium]